MLDDFHHFGEESIEDGDDGLCRAGGAARSEVANIHEHAGHCLLDASEVRIALQNEFGGPLPNVAAKRLLDMLSGEQLPRIC